MIIFDLDGTLADCEHRRHFVDPNKNPEYECDRYCYLCFNNTAHPLRPCKNCSFKPNWKAFFEACDKDAPIEPVLRICNYLILMDHEIQIWSGRCESVRDKTEEWLYEHLFGNEQYPVKLKMRPIGDNTPDDQLKERWLDEALAAGHKIDYVFDDRPKVVAMWRRRGIFVFDCNQTGREF